jgi:predicted O-methyltransferase YrrM
VHIPDSLVLALARASANIPSGRYRRELVRSVMAKDSTALLEGLGPLLNRNPTLESTPLDLDPAEGLEFEDLAGFFASSALNHGLIGMTFRQGAYLFGLTRRSGARTAIEIGRYRGGSTIVIAAAMAPEGRLWSIDVGEKEARMFAQTGGTFDNATRDFCTRFGLHVEILVGDSRTLDVDTGEVDLVFIDGDHTYEGVRNDFERFGRRVPVGGAVLLDDAFPDDLFESHVDWVGRLVREIEDEGDFRLVKAVDRLAHLERVR